MLFELVVRTLQKSHGEQLTATLKLAELPFLSVNHQKAMPADLCLLADKIVGSRAFVFD